jgi:hypothetical protein
VIAAPPAGKIVPLAMPEIRPILRHMFGGIKDSLTSSAAKSFIASRIARYGTLTELRINSREKTILADVLLEGEDAPIRIEVGRYRIAMKHGEPVLTVESVRASRAWLSNLLQDLVIGRELPLPSMALVALGGAEPTA